MDIRLHSHETLLRRCQDDQALLYKTIPDESLQLQEQVTMLWQACALGVEPLVKTFLSLGGDPNFFRMSDQVSCLYIASQNGFTDVCRTLLEGGAEINIRRNTKATPLFIATQRNHVDVVKLLLQRGANTELENDQKCSPIVLACNMGHIEIVRLLLQHNCNVFHHRTGYSPLQWSRLQNHHHVLTELRDWILQKLVCPMATKYDAKNVFSIWKCFAAQKVAERNEIAERLRQETLNKWSIRQAVLNGAPLPSIDELALTSFDTSLSKPALRLVSLPSARMVWSDTTSFLTNIKSREESDTKTSFPSPKKKQYTEQRGVVTTERSRALYRSPPSTSKTYEAQKKSAELFRGLVSDSEKALLHNALCTQHFY